MKLQELKVFAKGIRNLLTQQGIDVTYSQGLDLSGALLGLRCWPEVVAFPERVDSTHLDLKAAQRLARRLFTQFGVEFAPKWLLQALEGSDP